MMNEKALCTARELAIGYGKTPLLSDICLGAQPGQILTLIGPNGAGKSTLLKTLAGQLAPMGGTVLLAGKDLTAYTGTQRAQKLALMAPHSRRMELTTCFDFVSAGRYPYTGRLGILSAEDRQQVHRALELVGAAQLADRDFNRISDGQRQRILLARALCQQPEVILLDEPTSFLDIKGKIELLTILKELAHTGQLAVILSLHELELAEKIADTVVCVSPGGVSGVLTPEQAFQPENIRTLYGLTEQQYTALFGTPEPEAEKAPAGKPQFEHYVRSGQKLLRCGYTTGTCAALGAAGAARLLLTGREPETVALRTPKGIVVEVAPIYCRRTDAGAVCAIRKDGGDDVDVTTGLPVIASVVLEPDAPGVRILGGEGVGRVTKPGLDQPVGEAAINHVPRQMIAEALEREAENAAYTGGFAVSALMGGCRQVTSVDTSQEALDVARQNVEINGLDLSKAEFVRDDVFKLLRKYRDQGEKFDVIVMDPPKFVENKSQLMGACRGYKDINMLAIQLLNPGGVLLTFSCSGLMTTDLFQKIIADAAIDAGRDVQFIEQFRQAADHPVIATYPEGLYLKGFACRVM